MLPGRGFVVEGLGAGLSAVATAAVADGDFGTLDLDLPELVAGAVDEFEAAFACCVWRDGVLFGCRRRGCGGHEGSYADIGGEAWHAGVGEFLVAEGDRAAHAGRVA